MKIYNLLIFLFLGISIFSCDGDHEENTMGFTLNFSDNKTEFQLGDKLTTAIESSSGSAIDSVSYFFGGQKLKTVLGDQDFQHIFRGEKLGKWTFRANVYSRGKKIELNKEITLFNNQPPKLYSYKITGKYPHSVNAYTQGLEFHKDTLYESTGQYGESSLRKVNFKTGEVLQLKKLEDSYFAEGISILNNKIHLLTWREGMGFIYDIETFEKVGSFAYNKSEEGWGLTNDGTQFYKSDGTEKIWILDSASLSEKKYIQTVTHRTISTQLNELEWVEGYIYANTYQKDGVAMINPKNGAIVGIIDFSGLRDQLGNEAELDPINDVLNGIAYNPNTKKLYVTGKDWDTLFEVEIVEQ